MKHMKRVTSFLLAMLLTLSLCVSALALTPTTNKKIVKAGEEVQVTLTTDQAMQNIVALQAAIYWDGSVFDYKSFAAEKDEQMTVYNGDKTDKSGRTYRTVDYVSTGKGKFDANAEFAVFTFTAKKDIDVSKTTDFVASIIYSKTLDTENNNAQVNNKFVTAEKTLSVTVTPASTEVKGYAVAASAVNSSITVKEDAQVALKISNNGVNTYNAYYMEVSYDTSVLTYKGINTDASVIIDNSGILKIAGYGDNKTCGTDNIVLTFTGKAIGKTEVTVISAKVDVKANAAEKDAPAATITTGAATITVGGYQVSLPDGFTGKGTANPGEDYTFTANDTSKKYDFTGSTMGDKTVEVIDIGNGTYTVKNVSGKLVIKATEKVAINLSGDAVNTIVNKSWGEATEVDAGKELSFTAQPESGKELVVTVNGKVVEGSIVQGIMWHYTIAADQVTGPELNIVVSYKVAGKATINESGAAWAKVGNLRRIGWTQSGDKVDAGATLEFFFKPESGKTIKDYVIRANNEVCTYEQVGGRYKVKIPRTIITAGATVTINFDYAATPEPTITVDVAKYLDLNGQSIFLITAACGELTEGKVLAYDGNAMYWSEKYSAYAWLVISDKTLDEVEAEAAAAVKLADGEKTNIDYTGDVNLTGVTDINDAQLVWNMYNAEYKADTDFQTVNRLKYLSADMNGNKTLDTSDAAAIVNMIVGNGN